MHRLQCTRAGSQNTQPGTRASHAICCASKVGVAAAVAHTMASTSTHNAPPVSAWVATCARDQRHAINHMYRHHHMALTTRHMLIMHTHNMASMQHHCITPYTATDVGTATMMYTNTPMADIGEASSSTHPASPTSPQPSTPTIPTAPTTPTTPFDPHTPLKVLAAAAALAVALGAMRAISQSAARQRMLERRVPPSSPNDHEEDGVVSPTMQAARAEWEASAGEEWWKDKLRQREEEEASLDFWSSSSSGSDNDTLTTDPSTNTDPPTQPLSPAAQWQAVAKEEWWKTDAIKDDPNWWQRDREAFGTDPGSPLSGGSATANGGENSAPPGGGAGNGVGLGSTNGGAIGYGYTNRSSNGAMGGIGGIGGGIDGGASSDAAGGVGQLRETVKREAQYVVDSAMARLMAMRLALTRSARQKAFEKQDKGPCDYQVDPSTCTEEQRVFLQRKERALRGEGPLIPESSNCQRCQGVGMLTCFWCDGKGKNTKGVEEIMGSKMEDIIPRNGIQEVRWNLMKGGPCFLCQGRNGCIVGCPDCQGTGIVGYITKYKE